MDPATLGFVNGSKSVMYNVFVLDVSFPLERARGPARLEFSSKEAQNDDNDEMNGCWVGKYKSNMKITIFDSSQSVFWT